eukprot:6205895-Pleurochrysis_carterae.AAC.2
MGCADHALRPRVVMSATGEGLGSTCTYVCEARSAIVAAERQTQLHIRAAHRLELTAAGRHCVSHADIRATWGRPGPSLQNHQSHLKASLHW